MRLTIREGIILVLLIICGCILSSYKNKFAENAVRPPMGLTFNEFVAAYDNVAKEYYGERLDKRKFQAITKENRKLLYLYTGTNTALEIELYGTTEYISGITVFGEPKGPLKEETVKLAGSIYVRAIMAMGSDFTWEKASMILNKLSGNLKHSSVSSNGLEFTSAVFDGILMLSIKATE